MVLEAVDEEVEGVAGEVDPSVVVAGSQEVLAALPGLSSGMTTMCLIRKPQISKLAEAVGVVAAVGAGEDVDVDVDVAVSVKVAVAVSEVVEEDEDEDFELLGLGSQLSLEPDQFQRQTCWEPLAC